MFRLLPIFCLIISQAIWAVEIPRTKDLQQAYVETGRNSSGQEKVVMLLVSQPNCNYCLLITEEIIHPMLLSGHYESTTLFSELEINTGGSIKDFNGQQVGANTFAQRYNAWATPTLLFLNNKGEEIAEKMVGINTLDLYGYYVDKSLNTAFKKINP
ncbi:MULTISPECIES: thioredoxin fold domain-containing protein [unclassified Neptuniibacter]|jgi:thioredoxin-related protein|uniref:thioredoxin family protein n=1 Tax=unclassified Neptuniibacter TaxID=2630693 RepID=UPI0026E1D325|nr:MULTISPECIES: thioredoxin fold domain-containing protein [unclassified Neptuniibacter]MDO6513141.1 thioredoxin fold domain-containing protein [Neptuniibacter sp. 2_MG-2023]MDO6592447.1 thioredoxin fold domain-containing protein [Neptuniibacter sp. 1_MG-2023]